MNAVSITLPDDTVVEVNVPAGYKVTDRGVFKISHDKNGDEIVTYISGLIWNDAVIQYKNDPLIYYLVRGINVATGGLFEAVVSRADLLAENLNSTQRELANSGAGIAFGRGREALSFLYSQNPKKKILGLTSTGWHNINSSQKKVYVSPYKIYRDCEDLNIRYFPKTDSQIHRNIYPNCTVKEQKEHIGELCKGNPLLLFALGHGFGALMATPLERDCLNVHLYGLTTIGKTTITQVCAGIMGNGVAPNTDPDRTSINTWNTTSNGLERLAAESNDMACVIDELGANTSKEYEQDLYKLFNGVSKNRMNPDGSFRPLEKWRVSVFSNGELSSMQMVQRISAKNAVKGGTVIRSNDIPCRDIFMDCKGMEPAEFGELIKHNCSKYFGAYGDGMLQYLVETVNDGDRLKQLAKECTEVEASLLDDNLSAPERRSVKRFGLPKLGLLKAASLGMLDVSESEIHDAVTFVRDLWLENATVISDLDRAIEKLRDFIRQNQHRFRSVMHDQKSDEKCRDIVGYWSLNPGNDGTGLYHFIPNEFKLFCELQRVNHRDLLRVLVDQGVLYQNNTDRGRYRFTSRHRIAAAGSGSYYSIKSKLLDEFPDEKVNIPS